MQEIKAPLPIPDKHPALFLGGSIEMGLAERWQDRIVGMVQDTNWIVLNPRRDAWDSSWEQSIKHGRFREQVEWELDAMEHAAKILMYLSPKTRSPISLLEIGLFARKNKLIVVCPHGFWRKGNVDIVCARYGVPQENSLEDAVERLRRLKGWGNVQN